MSCETSKTSAKLSCFLGLVGGFCWNFCGKFDLAFGSGIKLKDSLWVGRVSTEYGAGSWQAPQKNHIALVEVYAIRVPLD